ncbi:MAG: aminotransferase class V-fold PLP-dependent enzyme [Clostridiales Family XIII bacterium]|jgi:lysine decarboxylase|nr:aminotransferase class V-fold PLP-dependent enzyme [Clostridiales Family XIII bacterium]
MKTHNNKPKVLESIGEMSAAPHSKESISGISSASMYDFLKTHAECGAVSFHMPGHKGGTLYREYGFGQFLDNIMDCDITEIPGADNLFQSEGIIRQLEARYARLYGAGSSRILVNGSSCGLIAAVLASVGRGGKLIMARNSHKSIFNALTLGDINPVYAYPSLIPELNISGSVSPDEIHRLLSENPDADAVILPSPNYYGICSDIEAIAEISHSYDKILIVDQAHGAHLKFFRMHGIDCFPKPAEESGADLVINSTHKTLASFTQSAVINICGRRLDRSVLDDKLQCIESSSPSYLLMASLDINAALLECAGGELMRRWHENIIYFYKNAKDIAGLDVFEPFPLFDHTKLNFSFAHMEGKELEAILNRDYGIFPELYTGGLVMCMTGIGNSRSDIDKLLDALAGISAQRSGGRQFSGGRHGDDVPHGGGRHGDDVPHGGGRQSAMKRPAEVYIGQRVETFAIPSVKRRMLLDDAVGAVCAGSVIPYPPGIPLVCPGEKFTAETIALIKKLRHEGEKVIGLNERDEVLAGR